MVAAPCAIRSLTAPATSFYRHVGVDSVLVEHPQHKAAAAAMRRQRRRPVGPEPEVEQRSLAVFPARKSLEEFDFDHVRGLKRDLVAHLGTLDFIAGKGNVVFLGPPGTGKTHLAIGLAIRACQAGHRVAFATASQWAGRLAAAHAAGKL